MKTFALTFFLTAFSFTASAVPLDTARIEELTGLKGAFNETEGVFKVTQERNDVKISVDGWRMPPFMGLTSWAAFTPGKAKAAMVMGDVVLFQDEVNPVMSSLFANGLTVTALHNHFVYDEPKVYFMHVGGEGSAEQLATGVRAAFDQIKAIRDAAPEPRKNFNRPVLPERNAIDAKSIETILGKGQSKDGMFKMVIGRKAQMECGCEVGKEMGVNTWAAFAGTDDDAIVDGDFVVLESELQPVLRSLRGADINIVAIHHHMTGENPRYLFLHYWGRGTTTNLAKAVKDALAQTAQISR